MSKTKMNPVIKTKWTTRLRELDNDQQGQGCLKNYEGKMCCLGVLTEIAVEEGVISAGVYDSDAEHYVYTDHEQGDTWYGVLPPGVADWADIPGSYPTNRDPYLVSGEVEWQASIWNDEQGVNFDEIADMIDNSL